MFRLQVESPRGMVVVELRSMAHRSTCMVHDNFLVSLPNSLLNKGIGHFIPGPRATSTANV